MFIVTAAPTTYLSELTDTETSWMTGTGSTADTAVGKSIEPNTKTNTETTEILYLLFHIAAAPNQVLP
jgi:hypothetical protein